MQRHTTTQKTNFWTSWLFFDIKLTNSSRLTSKAILHHFNTLLSNETLAKLYVVLFNFDGCYISTSKEFYLGYVIQQQPSSVVWCLYFQICWRTRYKCLWMFAVIGDSFYSCLTHLAKVLKWCEECNLVLN